MLRRAIAATLTILALAGCADSTSSESEEKGLEGTYTLRWAEGRPIPLTLQVGTDYYRLLTAGFIRITRDSIFTSTTEEFRQGARNGPLISDSTYTRAGKLEVVVGGGGGGRDAVFLVADGQYRGAMTVRGDTLDWDTWLFVR